jgi:hypothetical protein
MVLTCPCFSILLEVHSYLRSLLRGLERVDWDWWFTSLLCIGESEAFFLSRY